MENVTLRPSKGHQLMGNHPTNQLSPVALLQRHINKRDTQLRQYRADLKEAQDLIALLRHGIECIKDKYMQLGLDIQKPIETKLLCGNIVQDVINIEKTMSTSSHQLINTSAHGL